MKISKLWLANLDHRKKQYMDSCTAFCYMLFFYITLVKNRTHNVTKIIPATNLMIFLLLTLFIAKSPSLVLNADIQ